MIISQNEETYCEAVKAILYLPDECQPVAAVEAVSTKFGAKLFYMAASFE